MNFLLRPTIQHVTVKEQVSVSVDVDESPAAVATLEGLIAEDGDMAAAIGGGNASVVATKNESLLVLENHSDVSEEEGWIIIPYVVLGFDSSNGYLECVFLDHHALDHRRTSLLLK
ncbi:hypothetical protein H0E87_015242 [Populus deltoides]|uniref:Uncharacterized protein n=1 Tax=Populus deltoides TaxID=3696 RepID=A0A8T2Y466_POPDE|nr:hypothetical protein H0E87_015242 [Populus deltoides]